MKILIDTNVVLDVIGKRQEFYENSFKALQLVYVNHTPCVSATTVTDIMYLSRKLFASVEQQKIALADFFSDFKIIPISKKQILQAFCSQMNDFEDAIQAFCAKKAGVKLIISRNIKDYALSPVYALSPADFIKL